MTGARSLYLVLVLAACSIAGIIGMLLFEGAGDVFGLALTALPLIVGGVQVRRQRP